MNQKSKALFFLLGFLFALALTFGLQYAGIFSLQSTGFLVSKQVAVESSLVEPVFSPGSLPALEAFLGSAEKSVDVELYEFSNHDLMQSLADLAGRGVEVRVILEPRVNLNFATAKILASNGVVVRWASQAYANTHSKTAVVDGKRVLVGSINWSMHAVSVNRESAVIIDDERVASEFENVFEEDWRKASAYVDG